MIARLADGLPLAASMQEDEQVGYYYYRSDYPHIGPSLLLLLLLLLRSGPDRYGPDVDSVVMCQQLLDDGLLSFCWLLVPDGDAAS